MMTSFYNLLKYAQTGIASPDMSYYDKLRASTLMGGTVQTLTGIPPLSFKADGTPLISWSMKGNGSQQGTPTPDTPIMPTFCGVRTANLFTLKNGTYIIKGVTVTITDGNTASFSGVSDGGGRLNKVTDDFILPAGTYSYATTGSTLRPSIILAKTSDNTALYNGSGGFTLDAPTSVYGGFNFASAGADYTGSYAQTMLVSGSYSVGDVPDFEPFGYKIPISCAGQTVPVYLGQVQTVRRVKKLVLTGEESWSYAGGQAPFQYLPSNFAMLSQDVAFYVCSHYKAIPYNASWSSNDKFVSASAQGLRFKDSSFGQSLDDFKSYLAAQYANGTPVTVWYVLATPETAIVNEPLCKIGDYADELHSEDAAVTIPTVKGSNTLTIETELQPSEMSITYRG